MGFSVGFHQHKVAALGMAGSPKDNVHCEDKSPTKAWKQGWAEKMKSTLKGRNKESTVSRRRICNRQCPLLNVRLLRGGVMGHGRRGAPRIIPSTYATM